MNNLQKLVGPYHEVDCLRRELKVLNAKRAKMTDPIEQEAAKKQAHALQAEYNAALQKLKEMANEYEWDSISLKFRFIDAADI
ncbi:MAG: hypothetical protein K5660_07200 [Paludibacteraceae bacterium]|nr:hypothetical protein [Paludibacteraceae bacterium]